MVRKSQLHLFNNQPFSAESLLFLQPTFHASFAAAISKFADRDFLKVYGASGITQKTFAQFAGDVEKCRRLLLEKFPDKRVIATIDGNTYENLAFMTGAILGGFVLAPINPMEGEERIQKKLEQIAWPAGVLRAPLQIPTTAPRDARSKTREPVSPMILMFTSGSTGYSKIVQQPESAILSNIDALIELHSLDQIKIVGTPLPIFHVNALEFAFFGTLMSGSRLILYESFDFAKVVRSLEDDKVQIFSAVPGVLKSLNDFSGKIPLDKLKLEYCVTAATMLAPPLAKDLAQKFPFKIIQGYGLSEAVNFSCLIPPQLSKQETDHWLADFQRPSIGTPLRGNHVEVLSETGEPLAEKAEGEIAIRGHNVMIGYKDVDNNEMYRISYLKTGDIGHYIVDPKTQKRFFFITSRKKEIIKRHGITISLVEIDDEIQRVIPAHITAIAVPFDNVSSGEDVGVVVSHNASPEHLKELKEHLQKSLPPHLWPRVILQSSEKLRTESGKPRRWALQSLFSRYQTTLFGKSILIEI